MAAGGLGSRFGALCLDDDDGDRAPHPPATASAAYPDGGTVTTEVGVNGGRRELAAEEPAAAGPGQPGAADEDAASSPVRHSMPLVWVDLEMTGLDIEKHRILEIACIITDGRLKHQIAGPDLVINETEEVLAGMNEWCQEHHLKSGLVDRVRSSNISLLDAEQQVLAFVQRHTQAKQAMLAGNSVYVDFLFMKKYMPLLAEHFSHVVVDVSTIAALCARWYPQELDWFLEEYLYSYDKDAASEALDITVVNLSKERLIGLSRILKRASNNYDILGKLYSNKIISIIVMPSTTEYVNEILMIGLCLA
eukprot:SM000094S24670  [mRNA]  locus=s94:83011:85416:+ [translate_table: standard]